MNFFNFIRLKVKDFASSIKENITATLNLIGISPMSDIISDEDKKSGIRVVPIKDRYRVKPVFFKNPNPPAEKLSYKRVYRKGMKVVAYSYDKQSGKIGARLNSADSIKEMAQYYLVHPTIVSSCAVYNALDEKYGTFWADNHVRKIRKYVTPGTLSSLPVDKQNIVQNYTNSVTFKYELQ